MLQYLKNFCFNKHTACGGIDASFEHSFKFEGLCDLNSLNDSIRMAVRQKGVYTEKEEKVFTPTATTNSDIVKRLNR